MMLNMGVRLGATMWRRRGVSEAKQRSTEHVVPKSAEEMFRLSAASRRARCCGIS